MKMIREKRLDIYIAENFNELSRTMIKKINRKQQYFG